MRISKEETEEALGYANLVRLRRCVASAVDGYYSTYTPEQRAEHTPRTRASTVHDRMRRAAEREFDGVPGVMHMDVRGLFVLNFADRVIIRFKKLESDLRSRGQQTQQFLDFIEQSELDGIASGVPHLEVGYVLNSLQTGYESIHLVFPAGPDSNLWAMELYEDRPAAEVTTLRRDEPTDANQKRRFRSKIRIVRTDGGEPTA